MHITLTSLIDFLGLSQGILFAAILIFSAAKNRPALFLGLFLLTYSLELCPSIITDTGLEKQFSRLHFLPFHFYFLSLPLLFLYAKSLTSERLSERYWLHLLPGLTEFLFLTFVFLSPAAARQIFEQQFFSGFGAAAHWLGGLFFSVVYAVLIYLMIKKHQRQVLDFYSEIENKRLRWLQGIAVFLVVFATSWIVFDFFSGDFATQVGYPIMSAINVIFIYWVGLTGIRQQKVGVPEHLIDVKMVRGEKIASTPRTSEAITIPPHAYKNLLQHMETQKPYTNPELNLSDLARQLDTAPKQLSQLINQYSGVNFNHFVNDYRVAAAKKLLTDPSFDHFSAEGIGYEVGFNSKASFYAVFKEIAGVTPAAWRKNKDFKQT